METGQEKFISLIMEEGFTKKEAEHIFSVYQKAKALKYHAGIGSYTVKHGALWDKDVLNRALKQEF